MHNSSDTEQDNWHYREMTVAHIRESEDADHVQIVFLESARFYTLRRDNPAFEPIMELLRDALARPRVLKVGLASLESEIIKNIHELA